MPHTVRRVGTDDETLAELTVLAGYDDDLAGQSTRLTNRLRDALPHIHPALQRLLGPRLDHGAVLDLLAAAPTPTALSELGADGIAKLMRTRSPRLARTLPDQILTALDAQTLLVPGTAAFARVATQLRDVHAERDDLGAELEARPQAHPLGPAAAHHRAALGAGAHLQVRRSTASYVAVNPPLLARRWLMNRPASSTLPGALCVVARQSSPHPGAFHGHTRRAARGTTTRRNTSPR
jgi:hypothetical protein